MDINTAKMIKELVEAWRHDLEWGSHHLNNAAAAEFSRQYPKTTEAIQNLEARGRMENPEVFVDLTF